MRSKNLYEYCYICHDNNESTGEAVYLWWSEFIDDSHIDRVWPGVEILSAAQNLADNFACWNYLNPLNPTTKSYYRISNESPVTIKIFNLTGQLVYTFYEGVKKSGTYSAHWDGLDESGIAVAGSIYFYQLQAGNFRKMGKMTLMR